jgi:hypothetical protein
MGGITIRSLTFFLSPFSGWNESFFGDLPMPGGAGIPFYTQPKVTTSRLILEGDGDMCGENSPYR